MKAADPYCNECGTDDPRSLAYVETVANGDEYECAVCGNTFFHVDPEESA